MQDYSHVKTRAYIPCTTDLESKKAKELWAMTLKIHLNLPKTNCSGSNSILKLEHFLKALYPVWLQRERKDDVIWSDLKGPFYFKVEVKSNQILNYLLLS